MTATVLIAPGAMSGGDTASVAAAFGGPDALLAQLGIPGPANVVPIKYNTLDTLGGYVDCANKLAAAIHAAPDGPIVAVGHSYGAVGICQLIRSEAKLLAGVDPARVVFVCAANSIRLNTGYSTMMGLYGPGGGPVSSKWQVIDVAREFDKWADQPNNWASPSYWAAYNSVNAGDNVGTPTTILGGVPNNIHNNYSAIRLDGPHAERTIGSVTFMLFETDPVPLQNGLPRAQLATAWNRIVAPNW
jgi:hypothetical protein